MAHASFPPWTETTADKHTYPIQSPIICNSETAHAAPNLQPRAYMMYMHILPHTPYTPITLSPSSVLPRSCVWHRLCTNSCKCKCRFFSWWGRRRIECHCLQRARYTRRSSSLMGTFLSLNAWHSQALGVFLLGLDVVAVFMAYCNVVELTFLFWKFVILGFRAILARSSMEISFPWFVFCFSLTVWTHLKLLWSCCDLGEYLCVVGTVTTRQSFAAVHLLGSFNLLLT